MLLRQQHMTIYIAYHSRTHSSTVTGPTYQQIHGIQITFTKLSHLGHP